MLKFKIKEKLFNAGIQYPQTWLSKTCGFGYAKAHNIFNSKQKAISLNDLSKLCENLQCTPNDLFYWENKGHWKVPDDHPLMTQLSPPDKIGGWKNLMKKMSAQEAEMHYEDIVKKIEKK